MKTVYNQHHAAHAATHEFFRGKLVPAFEVPARADYVLAAVKNADLGPVLEPSDHGLAPLERVHAPAYLRFVRGAHAEWLALGGEGDAFPAVWPVRSLRSDVEPRSFAARMGLYSMDSGTPLTAGSWEAAYWGAQASLTGLDLVLAGEPSAYVLTRPPGHHAGADFFGGYCFVNNAAVAAQAALDRGLRKVAILDVDYHHGNGTQQIFYDRADVLFVSIHGDPRTEFPFYLGFADERGAGEGEGCNLNLPLPAGSDVPTWMAALEQACTAIAAFRPDALVVSLGLDTYEGDPISTFKLKTADFHAVGARLARLGLQTLFCLEGGYAVGPIGENAVSVLNGFDGH